MKKTFTRERKCPYKCIYCGEAGWSISAKRTCCDKCKGEYSRRFNKKWRAERRAAKLCIGCGVTNPNGKSYCDTCLVRLLAKVSARQKVALAEGKCFRCNKVNDYIKHNKWLCRSCALRDADAKRQRRAAAKVLTTQGAKK